MKFHWFAEVTYGHTTAEEVKNNHTWVDAPATMHDPLKVGKTYQMFIRLMQLADRSNFDGLAVNEHHQTSFAMSPSPNLIAASVAGTTENAAILIIGDSLALYNPPTRIAEEMAYLDCLSEGRVIAGFVYGTPMDSTFCYGVPPVELRDRFREARELILKAWESPEPFAFNGKYNKLRYVNLWPRPVQKPRPPIWVPGSGSVETWDLVIDEDYCYGHLSFSGLRSAKPVVDGFWDYVDQRGGDTNPNRMAFTQICCVAETDEQAEKDYAEAVNYFYSRQNVNPAFAQPPGYRTVKSIAHDIEMRGASSLSNEDRMRAARGEMSFWEYDEKGYIIAGTPERVRQRIRELATDLRIGQLIPTLHMGNLSEELAAKNTQLFGTEVIPYLRDLWADQPDHWTPAVSQQRVNANMPQVAGVAGN
ncbi:MAG: LLM class flavin-dependent oxidoreductase [Chloroflexi bacterium]|nr:LLM class flavin-dependent oxidoreductase [Chloroflexota bacterium]MDA1003192.1 LLM class flavin-dependent oxidoreductase [Chloroflexota bacterium]